MLRKSQRMNMPTIALLGNPNCGKTTLFNALTGSQQHVGNWPGVTVERKTGQFTADNQAISVVDLPGTYSLISTMTQQSYDERLACEYILSGKPQLVVNVVDGCNLERHLFLTSQLLEMGVPVVVAVNRMDKVAKQERNLDLQKLSELLGCPVVGVSAHKHQGIDQLKKVISHAVKNAQATDVNLLYPEAITLGIQHLHTIWELPYTAQSRFRLLSCLEGDAHAINQLNSTQQTQLQQLQRELNGSLDEDTDIVLADARYRWAQQISKKVNQQDDTIALKNTLTARIDDFVLHRVWGIPIFLAVMYTMFLFAINLGGALQDLFSLSSESIFVIGMHQWLQTLHAPSWMISLIADGAGRGISTTMSFIPVIGGMFLFLSLLESSGYMARAAFVVDRLMRVMGLPGKSFVPMIIGFGCNVPAIMAARTLENPRDRVLTIMMSPFMSCGARLAIYAVFTAAFFPVGGQNIVFGLYLIGIAMAVVTGLILRKTLLRGESAPLVMEMPAYHWPLPKVLLKQTWFRLKNFIVRASKVIVPVCMLIGALQTWKLPVTSDVSQIPKNTVENTLDNNTVLAKFGQFVTPIFTPMGVSQDNWPATVGLLTGVMAKEVVVGTLNTLYAPTKASTDQSVMAGLHDALMSVPHNLALVWKSWRNPVVASAPKGDMSSGAYGAMYQRFGGPVSAFAYLLFILLYMPCVSAMAAMVREVNRRWALFAVAWTTGIAYGSAVLFYQLATIPAHWVSSLSWVLMIVSVFIITLMTMRRFALTEVV